MSLKPYHLDIIQPDGDKERVDIAASGTVLTSSGPNNGCSFKIPEATPTTDVEAGVWTPSFTLVSGFTGFPVTSHACFYRVGCIVNIVVTIFGIATPAGTQLCQIQFDLPVTRVDGDFITNTVAGNGTLFRLSNQVNDQGWITGISGTEDARFVCRNYRINIAVGCLITLTYSYLLEN